jgi:hypothetical protein
VKRLGQRLDHDVFMVSTKADAGPIRMKIRIVHEPFDDATTFGASIDIVSKVNDLDRVASGMILNRLVGGSKEVKSAV